MSPFSLRVLRDLRGEGCACANAALVALLMFGPCASVRADSRRLDGAACERVPLAPIMTRKSYSGVPPRQSVRSQAVTDVRRLLDEGALTITMVAKKSLAEGNPVLFTVTVPAYDFVDGVWTPAARGKGAARRANERGPLLLVGYDDAQQGGAFELMSGGAEGGFFWIRYEDFDRYCRCAVEAVGSAGTTGDAGTLAGGMRFESAAGVVMHAQRYGQVHRLQRAYPTGTRFRILVSASGPAYVYMFASDVTRKIYPIFPSDGGTPRLVYDKNEVAIPGEEKYLQLDDRPGTDYFCALYSTRKLDFAKLVRAVEEAKGDFVARVQTAVGADLIPAADVAYPSAGSITFTATAGDKSVTFIAVEMQHLR